MRQDGSSIIVFPIVSRCCLRCQNTQMQPQSNTGHYGGGGGGDVKPKMTNIPYGGQQKQASNPYGGMTNASRRDGRDAERFLFGTKAS